MKRTRLAAGAAMIALCCCSCADRAQIREKIAQDMAYLKGRTEAAPVPVTIMEAGFSAAVSNTNYVGRVEPSKSAFILNQFPGTVGSMKVSEGQNVRAGQVIAVIDSDPVKSAYDIAKATLDQAEDGYGRVCSAYAGGSITDLKMMEVKTQLEKARAAEKSARKALDDCTVTAPFDGIVSDVIAHAGEHVAAAAPLLQLTDLHNVEIHFSVPENEYSSIERGDKASVEVPALEKTLEASVAVKGVTASPVSHAYDFILKGINDAGGLVPGMVCKVRMHPAQDSCIVIPSSAVMTDLDGRYVWAVDGEDKVIRLRVNCSGFSGDGVIISEGVSEGDRIITEGSRKVSTGMKVVAK